MGASEYDLSFPGMEVSDRGQRGRRGGHEAAAEHPLTVSDPLSAGQVGPAVTLGTKSYLPLIFRGN